MTSTSWHNSGGWSKPSIEGRRGRKNPESRTSRRRSPGFASPTNDGAASDRRLQRAGSNRHRTRPLLVRPPATRPVNSLAADQRHTFTITVTGGRKGVWRAPVGLASSGKTTSCRPTSRTGRSTAAFGATPSEVAVMKTVTPNCSSKRIIVRLELRYSLAFPLNDEPGSPGQSGVFRIL